MLANSAKEMTEPRRVDLDLGDDHTLRYYTWQPDPELNPQYRDLPGSSQDKVGAIISHYKPDGSYCEGGITFDTPRTQRMNDEPTRWTVESWEPLTLSPSLLCDCGDHGFIRDDHWVRA
jgi:hypothetical protein